MEGIDQLRARFPDTPDELLLAKLVDEGDASPIAVYPPTLTLDGKTIPSAAMQILGTEYLRCPAGIALRIWDFDRTHKEMLRRRWVAAKRMDSRQVGAIVDDGPTVDKARLHELLCREVLHEKTPDWYLEALSGLQLTCETALRALGVRQSKRELDAIERAATDSRSANRSTRIVAWASVGAAVAGVLVAIVVAVVSTVRAQDVRVADDVKIDAPATAPIVVYAPVPTTPTSTTMATGRPSPGAGARQP